MNKNSEFNEYIKLLLKLIFCFFFELDERNGEMLKEIYYCRERNPLKGLA